jgi:hypothetical protein
VGAGFILYIGFIGFIPLFNAYAARSALCIFPSAGWKKRPEKRRKESVVSIL